MYVCVDVYAIVLYIGHQAFRWSIRFVPPPEEKEYERFSRIPLSPLPLAEKTPLILPTLPRVYGVICVRSETRFLPWDQHRHQRPAPTNKRYIKPQYLLSAEASLLLLLLFTTVAAVHYCCPTVAIHYCCCCSLLLLFLQSEL